MPMVGSFGCLELWLYGIRELPSATSHLISDVEVKYELEPGTRQRTRAGPVGNISSCKLSPQTSTLPWIFSPRLTGNSGGRIRTDHSQVLNVSDCNKMCGS